MRSEQPNPRFRSWGIVLAVALAVVIGMPTVRLTGHYFSMATIAVAELIRIFVGTWDFVGAAIGLQGPAIARGWWDLTFRSELPYYYLFLAVLALLLAVTMFIERRRFGFYLRAIKASERAAWKRTKAAWRSRSRISTAGTMGKA